MAPVSKLLKSINSPGRIRSGRCAGTGGWVQGASRLDPGSEETGSRVIWVEVVGGITMFGGILGGMTAGTFGGLMADASESRLSYGGVVAGCSRRWVRHNCGVLVLNKGGINRGSRKLRSCKEQ